MTLALLILLVQTPPPDPAGMTIPHAFGIQIKSVTPDDLDQIKEVGVRFVRRGFHWEGIEKEKGSYDFSGHDPVMKEIRDRGLRVLGVLAFGNRLYGPVRGDEGREAFAKYAAAAAARYKDDRVVWEVWNEPNTMTFWGRHGKKGNSEEYAAEYVALVKATVPAMRRADPGCAIVAGSVSCLWPESYKWIDACFAGAILRSGIDGWSVHPYSQRRPEDYVEAYGRVRDLMAKHGAPRDFPMWNTERGFPTRKAEGFAGGDPAMAGEYQAWHLVRQALVDYSQGLRLSSWYEWKNAREGFGLFDDGALNPAGRAYRVLIGQLRGFRLRRREPMESDLDWVLSFTGPEGELAFAAWTSPPPDGSPDKAVPHEVAIKVDAPGRVERVQLYGETAPAEVKGGAVTLRLSGAPQYLVIRKRK
jgi:hypothetical protein